MNNSKVQKLLFIYNANSGLRNLLIDGAHKILSPKTYDCNLCDITFGAFSENSRWKKFRKESELPMEFLHKDEFKKEYASKFSKKYDFPIVLAVTHSGMEIMVNTHELNALAKAEDLMHLISIRA